MQLLRQVAGRNRRFDPDLHRAFGLLRRVVAKFLACAHRNPQLPRLLFLVLPRIHRRILAKPFGTLKAMAAGDAASREPEHGNGHHLGAMQHN